MLLPENRNFMTMPYFCDQTVNKLRVCLCVTWVIQAITSPERFDISNHSDSIRMQKPSEITQTLTRVRLTKESLEKRRHTQNLTTIKIFKIELQIKTKIQISGQNYKSKIQKSTTTQNWVKQRLPSPKKLYTSNQYQTNQIK